MIFWAGYIIASPFYVFDSGLPQPADFFIAAGFVFVALRRCVCLAPLDKTALYLLLGFLGYAFIVAAYWTGVLDEPRILRAPLFYLFNALVLLMGLTLFNEDRDRFITYTMYALCITVLIQFVLALILGVAWFSVRSTQLRGVLFFNNPNQLSYFALLAMIGLMALQPYAGQVSRRLCFVAILASIYLNLVGNSLTTLLSLALCLVGFFLTSAQGHKLSFRKTAAVSLIILLAVPLIGLASGGTFGSSTVDRKWQQISSETRLGMLDRKVENFITERRISRLHQNPEYIFFGAGEGAFYRFPMGMEIHNTFVTILFSYGVIGAILFFSLLSKIIYRMPLVIWMYVLAIFVYWMTHQGVRFTTFWYILCILLCVSALESARGFRVARQVSAATVGRLPEGSTARRFST